MARSVSPRHGDLFDASARARLGEAQAASLRRSGADGSYTAKDIEVLEGLEPVRRRPGMYIGGTDERGLHHLFAEVLDNAMDEAVAGHASRIEVELESDGTLVVSDNGRGIPVDPHPKFRNTSALEVIMTTLHSGGKFSGASYETAGGLHGVGVSVVNALSEWLEVEVARDRKLWRQSYARGKPTSKLLDAGPAPNRRGTRIRFRPDLQIFGPSARFRPSTLLRMARSKAYLFRGVEIRWSCAPELAAASEVPEAETFHFPGGLGDYLRSTLGERALVGASVFAGEARFGPSAGRDGAGRTEWAIAWPADGDGLCQSYCNTIPTPQGGSHEAGLRAALTKAFRAYGERVGNRRAAQIAPEDVVDGAAVLLSLFIAEPQFQGQTKERLSMPEAARLVEAQLKDHADHWLASDPTASGALIDWAVERAEERLRRRQSKELERKSATRRTRLPGKLTDCSRQGQAGTELFLVEGDSAGGSAKQARNRETQAVLPLRGKILNVASASSDKLRANQELQDLVQALGCRPGKEFRAEDLRYERVIVMTDADVDGAHIAALLMTYFYREMPDLIAKGHLFLAVPPLYRLSQGGTTAYALDDAERDRLLKDVFAGRGKVEISRFKGLGEMPARQLKETTMDPAQRVLLQVRLPNALDPGEAQAAKAAGELVERLMGKRPELRFEFIRDHARFVSEQDLDV